MPQCIFVGARLSSGSPSRRSVITDVLGGELEFEFFHRWFNGLFLASVLLTALLFYGRHQASLDDAPPELPVYLHSSRD